MNFSFLHPPPAPLTPKHSKPEIVYKISKKSNLLHKKHQKHFYCQLNIFTKRLSNDYLII